jgi:peptide/nickel transport system permease protein
MLAYIVRRLLYAIPILIGVNLITFALFFVVNTPDDMARMQLGVKRVTPEAIEKWKAERGYDKPLFFNARRSGAGPFTDTIFFSKSARMFAGDFGAPTTAATSPAKSARAWGRRSPSRCRPSSSACS